jgi:hypothetical protein
MTGICFGNCSHREGNHQGNGFLGGRKGVTPSVKDDAWLMEGNLMFNDKNKKKECLVFPLITNYCVVFLSWFFMRVIPTIKKRHMAYVSVFLSCFLSLSH